MLAINLPENCKVLDSDLVSGAEVLLSGYDTCWQAWLSGEKWLSGCSSFFYLLYPQPSYTQWKSSPVVSTLTLLFKQSSFICYKVLLKSKSYLQAVRTMFQLGLKLSGYFNIMENKSGFSKSLVKSFSNSYCLSLGEQKCAPKLVENLNKAFDESHMLQVNSNCCY